VWWLQIHVAPPTCKQQFRDIDAQCCQAATLHPLCGSCMFCGSTCLSQEPFALSHKLVA